MSRRVRLELARSQEDADAVLSELVDAALEGEVRGQGRIDEWQNDDRDA